MTENNNPLKGKNIIFLGSSVTYGAASGGVSFADFIAERNGCRIIKEAVSGTTLTDDGPDSYVSRLKKIDRTFPADLFLCQLSTNDATKKKPLGDGGSDTSTVLGAVDFIISYARSTWNCPVSFYTSPRYESPEYGLMVRGLMELAEYREIAVIDLWNDREFNDITEKERALYMADPIHPTKEGYLKWWTPYFERELGGILSNRPG